MEARSEAASPPAPEVPPYDGPCIVGIVPGLLSGSARPSWFPEPLASSAGPVVLLVLDGLGWDQLQERSALAPTLSAMTGGPISSVVPSTTATALTSIVTGLAPGEHGIVGYRIHVGDGEVLNVLRWRTNRGDARDSVPPSSLRTVPPFCGSTVPAVVRAEFADTGFTDAHLSGATLAGWRMPSTLVVEVEAALRRGHRFVYAYYDGIDKVAHEFGLGPHFDAELAAADRLVADLLAALPADAVLAVTSDHGQVDVGDNVQRLTHADLQGVWTMSGEGRFLWLHCEPGAAERVRDRMQDRLGATCWVRTREEAIAQGWYGPHVSPAAESRLGDVAVCPFTDTAILGPDDPQEIRLKTRHGSLTKAEMRVPLLSMTGSRAL